MRGIRGSGNRPLRTATREHESRARDNARRGRGGASTRRAHERVEFDWDAAIGRLKVMLDELERK